LRTTNDRFTWRSRSGSAPWTGVIDGAAAMPRVAMVEASGGRMFIDGGDSLREQPLVRSDRALHPASRADLRSRPRRDARARHSGTAALPDSRMYIAFCVRKEDPCFSFVPVASAAMSTFRPSRPTPGSVRSSAHSVAAAQRACSGGVVRTAAGNSLRGPGAPPTGWRSIRPRRSAYSSRRGAEHVRRSRRGIGSRTRRLRGAVVPSRNHAFPQASGSRAAIACRRR